MEPLGELPSLIRPLLPLLAVLAGAALLLGLAHWILVRRTRSQPGLLSFGRQLVMLGLTAGALVTAILVLPISDTTRGQLLSLLGLLLTAIVALSSTSFVANAMAGLMLRAVGNFRPGDFVRVGEQFGRVSERGLFHTEIQTADRDLATLPNLYLVTNPVTVVRASGTIVSATVSLGYDEHHGEVERLLLEAARACGLEEPFVHVQELGDFSVGYRVAGFLADVKRLLSVRSELKRAMLDALHAGGVEIVSPSFMNQRVLAPEARVAAEPEVEGPTPVPEAAAPEERIFDKAEQAAREEEATQAEGAHADPQDGR